MAQTDRTKEMVDDTMALGRENRDILPSLRNWCSLLDISDQSVGLVHEVYGLPTHFRLSCQHAPLASAGMNLALLAEGFIHQHCRNCPCHRPLTPDNFGTRVLDELKKEEQAANERNEAERKTQQTLQAKIAELLEKTKKTTTPPAMSVLRLIEGLPNAAQGRQISEKINEASFLEPSFFIPEALDAMAVYYTNLEWGDLLLQATANVLSKGGKLSPFALNRCLNTLTSRVHLEELAKVASQVTHYSSLDQWMEWIEHFIHSLNYLQVFGYRDRSGTPTTEREAYISRCVHSDQKLMEGLFSRYLLSPEKLVRINIARLLTRIISDNSRFGLSLLPALTQALELPDDGFLESADKAIADTIAFTNIKNDSDALTLFHTLGEKIKSPTAALSVADVYILLIEDREFMEKNPGFADGLSTELPGTVLDRNTGFEWREKALETLSALVRSGKANSGIFSTLLGCLSQVNDEKKTFKWYVQELKDGKVSSFNPLAGVNEMDIDAIEMQLDRFRETLIDLIADELDKNPESNYHPFIDVLTGPDIVVIPGFKTDLLVVSMKGLNSPRFIARYIPHLYSQLFDMTTVQNRLQALYFLRKMIESHPQLVTETLLAVIDAFSKDPEIGVRAEVCTLVGAIAESPKIPLTEQHIGYIEAAFRQNYVFIQRRAILSARYVFPFMSLPRVRLLAIDLANIASNAGDPKHENYEKNALSVLIDIAMVHTALLPEVVSKLVVPLCYIRKKQIDRKYLDVIKDIKRTHPEYTDVWIKALISYLGSSNPDGSNPAFDRRNQHYTDLFESSYDLIVRHKAELYAVAETIVARNPLDALNFIYLFCEFEQYAETISLCGQIQKSVSNTRSNEKLLTAVNIIKTLIEGMITPGTFTEDRYKDIKHELQKFHS